MMNRREFLASILKLSAALPILSLVEGPALATLPFVGKTAAAVRPALILSEVEGHDGATLRRAQDATAYTLSAWVKSNGSPWRHVSVVGDGSEPLTLYVDGEQGITVAPAYSGKEIAAQIMENFVKYDIPGNDPGTNWVVL